LILAFQCSSASRKFLNLNANKACVGHQKISVLFSEPKIPQSSSCLLTRQDQPISVLFSEPKIPQLEHGQLIDRQTTGISVLFSEPKIPQSIRGFSVVRVDDEFQCSSASRKFLNRQRVLLSPHRTVISVLFSEPKIPQCWEHVVVSRFFNNFSALQRAENSSIQRAR